MAKPNREVALDSLKRTGSFSENEKEALTKAFRASMFPGNWDTGTPDDGDTFVYNASTETWEFEPAGVGDLLANGTVPLTSAWNAGPYRITSSELFGTTVYADTSIIIGNGTLTQDDFFYLAAAAADRVVLNFDNNDFLQYDRTNNSLKAVIGATTQMELTGSIADFQNNNITTTGKYVSTSGGDIDIEPDGTGNVLLGNFEFDADQTVGAGQDNYVLTYDHSAGTIGLEASASGFSDPMTARGDIIVRDASNTTARLAIGTSGQVLTSDGTDISWEDSISGVSEFTGLNDVPNSYSGQALKYVRVNAAADALEFTTTSPVTNVTASSPVTSSGGTTPNIAIPAATSGNHGYMTSTQAAKLDGIEAGADVTDATNVAAAGAYMKTVTVSTSAPSGGSDGDVWYQVV